MAQRFSCFCLAAVLLLAACDTAVAQIINDVQEMRAIIRKGVEQNKRTVLYRNLDWPGDESSLDVLAQYIKTYAAPGSWGEQGGRIHTIDRFPNSFLILQSKSAQVEVAELINSLPENLTVRKIPDVTTANGLLFLRKPKMHLPDDRDWFVVLDGSRLSDRDKSKQVLVTLRILVQRNGGPLCKFRTMHVRVYHDRRPSHQQEKKLSESIESVLKSTGLVESTIEHRPLLPEQTFADITEQLRR